jgi:hypothetical protein
MSVIRWKEITRNWPPKSGAKWQVKDAKGNFGIRDGMSIWYHSDYLWTHAAPWTEPLPPDPEIPDGWEVDVDHKTSGDGWCFGLKRLSSFALYRDTRDEAVQDAVRVAYEIDENQYEIVGGSHK